MSIPLALSIVELFAERGSAMDRVQKALVVNMKRFRAELGYSQIKMAELCNLSISFIAEIETGKKFPSSRSIERIATALGLEPYQLFKESEDPGRANVLGTISRLSRELKTRVNKQIDETTKSLIKDLNR